MNTIARGRALLFWTSSSPHKLLSHYTRVRLQSFIHTLTDLTCFHLHPELPASPPSTSLSDSIPSVSIPVKEWNEFLTFLRGPCESCFKEWIYHLTGPWSQLVMVHLPAPPPPPPPPPLYHFPPTLLKVRLFHLERKPDLTPVIGMSLCQL